MDSACVQGALTYETEIWAMKAENLHGWRGEYDGEVKCRRKIESDIRFFTVFWVCECGWGGVTWQTEMVMASGKQEW